jgi:small-conductance mechanosensitive channel
LRRVLVVVAAVLVAAQVPRPVTSAAVAAVGAAGQAGRARYF